MAKPDVFNYSKYEALETENALLEADVRRLTGELATARTAWHGIEEKPPCSGAYMVTLSSGFVWVACYNRTYDCWFETERPFEIGRIGITHWAEMPEGAHNG